jgi:hypothetical protein
MRETQRAFEDNAGSDNSSRLTANLAIFKELHIELARVATRASRVVGCRMAASITRFSVLNDRRGTIIAHMGNMSF